MSALLLTIGLLVLALGAGVLALLPMFGITAPRFL